MMLHWNKLLKVLWLNNLIIGTNQTRQNGGFFFFPFSKSSKPTNFWQSYTNIVTSIIRYIKYTRIHRIHSRLPQNLNPNRVSRVTSNINWRPRFPSSRSLFRKSVSRVPERLNGIIKQESVDMDMGGSSEGHGSRLWSPGRGTHRSEKGIRRFT